MAKTIKELAKELNCSYEAVRKQTKRYARELEEHIYTQHKTQYLDDFACDFIREKRMDTPSVISRIEYDEAVEALKNKYTELLEKHHELRDELEENKRLLAESNNVRGTLEVQCGALNADKDKLEFDLADLQKEHDKLIERNGITEVNLQNAQNDLKTARGELADAQERLQRIEDKWWYKLFGGKL